MTTKKPARCEYCANEAVYAMQFVAEETPTFSTLGSHYRGWAVIKVCVECADRFEGKTADEISIIAIAASLEAN